MDVKKLHPEVVMLVKCNVPVILLIINYLFMWFLCQGCFLSPAPYIHVILLLKTETLNVMRCCCWQVMHKHTQETQKNISNHTKHNDVQTWSTTGPGDKCKLKYKVTIKNGISYSSTCKTAAIVLTTVVHFTKLLSALLAFGFWSKPSPIYFNEWEKSPMSTRKLFSWLWQVTWQDSPRLESPSQRSAE